MLPQTEQDEMERRVVVVLVDESEQDLKLG